LFGGRDPGRGSLAGRSGGRNGMSFQKLILLALVAGAFVSLAIAWSIS
jgi:hypothetical protein